MSRQKVIRWVWMPVVVLLLFTLPATATIRDDFTKLATKYRALENQRKGYENRARKLADKRRLAEKAYAECALGRWQVLWEEHVRRSEEARKGLEKENRALIEFNASLRRLNRKLKEELLTIEQRHPYKNSKYDTEMRMWMDRVETEYFFPLENVLFGGYSEYESGIEKYLIFVNGAAKSCRESDLSRLTLEKLISHIPQIFEAATSIANSLLARKNR